MASIAELFAKAKSAHQSGNLAQADLLYREVIRAEPANGLAFYLLGVACHSLGKLPDAIQFLRQAAHLRPDHVESRNHLGIVFAQREDLSEAVACFEQALRLRPDFVEALKNLALALEKQGRLVEAEEFYRRAVRQKPDLFEVQRALGILQSKLGKHAEGLASLQKALRLRPDDADTHNDIGLVFERLRRLEEAHESYRTAIRLKPDLAVAHGNLALTLEKLGRREEAIAACREALRLEPGASPVHNNLGVLLEKSEDWTGAIACYRTALRLKPDFVEAQYNLGCSLAKLGQLDEAEAACRKALAIKPDSAEAFHNLAFTLAEMDRTQEAIAAYEQAIRVKPDFVEAYYSLAIVVGKTGRIEDAEALCRQAIAIQPDCAEAHTNLGLMLIDLGRIHEGIAAYREAVKLQPSSPAVRSSFLYGLNYDPGIDVSALLEEHRRWAASGTWKGPIGPAHDHDRDPDRRLRVGYVSPDLRLHPVAFFLQPILEHHDPRHVESFCYAEVARPDPMTMRLKGLAHHWRSTRGMSDQQVAELVRRDQIDLFIDLAGHTAHNRLGVLALRPAPVQLTYLGYPNTTGLANVDYLLTDAIVDPPGRPSWATESLYRLPQGFCCYRPLEDMPAVSALPASRTGAVTFGSLHKLAKLNDDVLDLWSTLLRAVPSARLLLFRNNLTGRRRDEVRAQFRDRGADLERIDLESEMPSGGRHFEIYHRVDVSLDVFPWCGHTTACESLWMGVPIITLLGDRHAGRMTASVLAAVGLDDWIAETTEQYIAKAQQLSSDPDSLARLRSDLRDRMRSSRLCDGSAWTRDLEDAFRGMWRRWCAGADNGR